MTHVRVRPDREVPPVQLNYRSLLNVHQNLVQGLITVTLTTKYISDNRKKKKSFYMYIAHHCVWRYYKLNIGIYMCIVYTYIRIYVYTIYVYTIYVYTIYVYTIYVYSVYVYSIYVYTCTAKLLLLYIIQ